MKNFWVMRERSLVMQDERMKNNIDKKKRLILAGVIIERGATRFSRVRGVACNDPSTKLGLCAAEIATSPKINFLIPQNTRYY